LAGDAVPAALRQRILRRSSGSGNAQRASA
jgi:hypothetical protein